MTTHVAGLDVTKDGRWVRQRCAWCGTVLVDEDATNVARPIEEGVNPEEMTPAQWVGVWAMGAMVKIDGPVRSRVEGEVYPDDACLAVDPAITA